ncbi:hypothetical protein R3W88_027758 [Solanum pinnatisectum]|uniref:Uncharacterized protein n=1 Tax=Solanum pinnatisectum TaxID=50273 RepID=A0AAV9LI70_9SOLN|nr:hypothetical protein R3W88_027758 [Solanum pinnatisectum]
MRSLGIALYLSVNGAANFISSLLITIGGSYHRKNGKSWLGKDLNSSRLDYFYWWLAIMTAVNLCVNVIVARNYSYKNVHCKAAMSVADCDDRDNHEAMT